MKRHPFDLLVELDTQDIRLDCAALHLARDVYPAFNLQSYRERLDELAEMVASQRPGLDAINRYIAMRSVLVDEAGISGYEADYYAPQNNYLNYVLDTGQGAPISLAIVWLEVARRLKWPVSAVSLPGHFMVRFDDRERLVLVDPFHDGVTRSRDDCAEMVAKRYDNKVQLRPTHLKALDTRAILVRLLRNLRNIYIASGDLPRVALTLERLVALQPGRSQHLRELAAIRARQGDVRGACAHLALYLHRAPDSRDSRLMRRSLKQLRAAVAALN